MFNIYECTPTLRRRNISRRWYLLDDSELKNALICMKRGNNYFWYGYWPIEFDHSKYQEISINSKKEKFNSLTTSINITTIK